MSGHPRRAIFANAIPVIVNSVCGAKLRIFPETHFASRKIRRNVNICKYRRRGARLFLLI